MPLDHELKALLSRGLHLPSLRGMSPAQARAQHAAAGRSAMSSGREAEDVETVTSGLVPTQGDPLEVRIYRPRSCPPHAPAVVYLHGGGWVLGDLDAQDATCRYLANRCGAVVVAVAYRLAPEHPYPAAVEDARAAVLWTQAHAEQLGADAQRVAVAGSSAGGNVAAGVALRLRDEGRSVLVAQLLLYPPTDPLLESASVQENSRGYYLTADDMRCFVDAYLPDPATRTAAYAAPLHAPSLAGLPPAVLVTAGFDPLRDEGVAYADRLRAADVPTIHLHFAELIHGFFGFANHSDAAARARDEILDAFAHLLGEMAAVPASPTSGCSAGEGRPS